MYKYLGIKLGNNRIHVFGYQMDVDMKHIILVEAIASQLKSLWGGGGLGRHFME